MLIRVDDFPHGGTGKPDRWEMMSHLMDNLDLPILLACVPAETTEEDIAKLRSDPRIEIGVHGMLHERKDHSRPIADWLWFRDKFGEPKPTVYVAPYNDYDHDAIITSAEVGYDTITGGPETNPRVTDWAKGEGLRLIWDNVGYGRSRELISGLSPVELSCRECITLHLTWEFSEDANWLRELHNRIGNRAQRWHL